MMSFSLEDLDKRIAARAGASPDESYTAKLLAGGVERCAKKFGEEAAEIIIASVTKDRKGTEGEASDVIYHLLVLLRAAGVPLSDVMAQLERRTAQSGLEEKASRGKAQS
ncbi:MULTISPECIES: phosphoribosyl-ATP diphosphatase [unclassified Devosia]|uniref:phosphoribosyl-ATP diphosphatase n=1 Tax=unclassified Devosia TaxID=196773 RepID=UPI00086A7805|nr:MULTISPECIES: phosphoribosyl-ATP diphosphatase [unclassified Devosia]MBN9362295.1 phosphoribosyl-ATP diphosphatase [Devosia sp.]ODS81486.1 MAG: phosphoribosyl-ATP diphosphatase [Devosia sp. SCN 66-27]OJX24461.1 MAG: phosphoribosyl-ATP diphosphatase [Devosia sp. 66-14]